MVSKDARSDRYSFQDFDLFLSHSWSTFWNMNSSVWTVWAAQGSIEKKVDLSFSEQFFEGGFFQLFVGKKK